MSNLETIAQSLDNLTLSEAARLAKMLREKWNIAENSPPAVIMDWPDNTAIAEKDTFDVVLRDIGPRKIEVIKTVRRLIADLGLKEAKQLVETPSAILLSQADKTTAMNLKRQLDECGATVELV